MLHVCFEPIVKPVYINSSTTCIKFLKGIWDKELFNIIEQVYVLYVNHDNKVICWKCLAIGTSNSFVMDVKLLLAIALGCLASKIIIAHNHPMGNCNPSNEDLALTNKLKQAASFMDIMLLDHVIISKNSYHSFREHGELE